MAAKHNLRQKNCSAAAVIAKIRNTACARQAAAAAAVKAFYGVAIAAAVDDASGNRARTLLNPDDWFASSD